MKRFLSCFLSLALLAVLAHVSFAQVVIIDDDLNADTSANYTVINGGHMPGDGVLDWAFDYSTLGIPPAPGTTDASTTGVHIRVNDTVDPAPNGGETEAYTIFHNTEITGVTNFTLTVDMWMGVWNAGDTGSTEHAHIGFAGDGVTLNQAFQASPFTQTGSGHFVFISGDGGDSSDYRHWEAGGTVNQFDPDYLSPDNDTNVTSANFVGHFDQIANVNAEIPGLPGNGWATVKVEVNQEGDCPNTGFGSCVKYFVRGYTDNTTGNPIDPPEFLQIIESELVEVDGFVSFGLGDLYNSVAPVPEDQFTVFDNFRLEGSNLPVDIPSCDFDGMNGCNEDDINMLTAEIASGNNNLDFDLTGDDLVNLEDVEDPDDGWLRLAGEENLGTGLSYLVGDADLNGFVDGQDFIRWNANKFTANTNWSDGNFNADGFVDGQDFVRWNGNKFEDSFPAPATVPEPASVTLLAIVGLLAGVRRRLS